MAEKENARTKKTIRTFGWASFLHDVGGEMIYPLWPIFVTSVLGAPVAALGFIDGLSDAIVSLSQAASGYISDRIKKRKIFIWLGYLCGAISRFGYAFAGVWQTLIPFRVLDRAGKMRDSPRDAIVADISNHGDRGGHFGFISAMDNLGSVFGVILAIVLLPILDYRNLFLIAIIPSLIATALVIRRIREPKGDGKIYPGLKFKMLTRGFILFLLLSSFFALATFSYSFLLLYAQKMGFKPTTLPFLYLIFAVLSSWSALHFGRLADQWGRKNTLAISFLMWGLVCIVLLLAREKLLAIVAFALYGLHKGSLDPVRKTLAAELAPKEYRASCLGTYQMIVGLCAFPASFVAGLLWDKIDIRAPLLLSLGLTGCALAMLIFIREPKGE